MANGRTLETVLQEPRGEARVQEELPKIRFNQHHRQFLNHLRGAGWVPSAKLPATPMARLTLLRNGWIETRNTATGPEYRITQTGLDEVCRPR